MRVLILLILGVWPAVYLAPPAGAQGQNRDYFRVSTESRKYAVIFAGAGADETYQARFQQWALKLYGLLAGDYGYPAEHLTLLAGRSDSAEPIISEPCRRDTISAALNELKKQVQPGDQIAFFFIGHGTSDNQNAKFVVAGPDITGADFAASLNDFAGQDVIVVNSTSSGYPFCQTLSAPGRVVVCATRSAAERYDTIFAESFLEGLENHAADRDRNQRVSMFEAFVYTREKVKKWYADRSRLPSEHPTIDDNGDSRFAMEPNPAEGEGSLAEIAYLDTISASLTEAVSGGPESEALRRLTAKSQDLERSVMLLRNQKSDMDEKLYWQQLEPLLIDLARTSRRLRSLQAAFEGAEDPSSLFELRRGKQEAEAGRLDRDSRF